MPQQNALPGLVFVVLFLLGLLIAAPSGNAGIGAQAPRLQSAA